jgi:hypothetical protein
MRRTRNIVLKDGQSLEDLDLWPGDRVLYGPMFILIGVVNARGQFVSTLETLH